LKRTSSLGVEDVTQFHDTCVECIIEGSGMFTSRVW